ncbi:MAG TPA: dTDP-4-dehydrorhamnose reductase [Acidobacteriaceae bacterium]|nr:dTDP-4-dehydrorhamnose reductase [Acidobacteriaceae bacterium]
MRVLVTGKDGQVGRELAALPHTEFEMVMAGRGDCDLAREESIRSLVRRVAPDAIVNAAAYTAVDKAETEQDLCFAVNATAPGALAEEAARLGALLIHYSTDYVFDGTKGGPYVESDPVAPLNTYGASKEAGERAVAAANGRFLVLRTSWVYGSHGKNFLSTMLRLAQERPEIRVVDDQIGAPTSAGAIARATARLLRQYALPSTSVPSGIYHMTAGGSTSWCGFARAIFEARSAGANPQAVNPRILNPRVVAITSEEYPTPAKRPKNSRLSNDRFNLFFGFHMPQWQEQMAEVVAAVRQPNLVSFLRTPGERE